MARLTVDETPMFGEDCPRCGQHSVTFDVLASTLILSEEYLPLFEAFVVCRRCTMPASAVVQAKRSDLPRIDQMGGGYINPYYEFRHWTLVIPSATSCPEHVPEEVAAAFREGAKCMAIRAFNAAGAMFRLCLDLTTKPLLPDPAEAAIAQPSKRERFNLGPRIDWLINQGTLPPSFAELAHQVRLDGNDGVHAGTLDDNDAADLVDFTVALLERQFTEPARLVAAKARQAARRQS